VGGSAVGATATAVAQGGGLDPLELAHLDLHHGSPSFAALTQLSAAKGTVVGHGSEMQVFELSYLLLVSTRRRVLSARYGAVKAQAENLPMKA
jgi:hypothetical protein